MKAILVFSVLIAGAKTSLLSKDLLLHERRDENALIDVSTPSSANYGKHLSKEEVNAYVAPKQETVDAVQAWLSGNGLRSTSLSPTGDWIGLQATVEQADALFDAKFSTFTHQDTGKAVIRTLSYSIPASLKGHLNFVHPTITFPDLSRSGLPLVFTPLTAAQKSNLTAEAVPDSCNTAITPACVQAIYGVPTTLATSSSNQLAVSGFDGEYANQADLTIFLQQFRPDLPSSTTFELQTIDGGENPQDPSDAGTEANLDIQYTVGIASGVPTVFISVGEQYHDGDLEGFLDIMNFLLGEDSPPEVLTTSYGQNENTISSALADQFCNACAQLGARGTSILFASGDGGVSGGHSGQCTTFVPTFPSGCPFLTSVGATSYVNDSETSAAFSSGGFSNYFNRPSYQSAAVTAYLDTLGITDSGLYNASGRAFPDVSALGVDVTIVVNGETGAVEGTSCSSPIFSSIISLLNDRLITAGKSPLGFLNPFLYSTGASALNDVITGDNPGCGTDGFPVASGWDPVTGLGTPNFSKLLTAVGLH